MDWTIVAGAVLGSGLTLGGVWLTARQRERADPRAEALEQRAEWGRRLAMALGELAEGENRSRVILGREILKNLAKSDLATEQDRELARILLRGTIGRKETTFLDDTGDNGDNNSEDRTGGPR